MLLLLTFSVSVWVVIESIQHIGGVLTTRDAVSSQTCILYDPSDRDGGVLILDFGAERSYVDGKAYLYADPVVELRLAKSISLEHNEEGNSVSLIAGQVLYDSISFSSPSNWPLMERRAFSKRSIPIDSRLTINGKSVTARDAVNIMGK